MVLDMWAFLESLARPSLADPELPDLSPDELPESWRKEFIERAAILEFDYGATREYAEAYALRETLKDMTKAGELFNNSLGNLPD